jgi:hypothetical protein
MTPCYKNEFHVKVVSKGEKQEFADYENFFFTPGGCFGIILALFIK